ncbi:hypothetical protein BDY19DRAFT_938840 [Irpex rosettiformis]|uniref:Uncharacterized protein n=1 Tax=Irpex rosettiformis TaxID=378272 RepID=A0ACB8U7D0_9APHY|nr:hypothetical protein BDY19DRAFT_938840 [Irpex rosettiformis]
MAQSLSPVVPTQLTPASSSVTRSTSIKSTNSASSGVSLRRRARTRARTLNSPGRRGKSVGPGGESRQDASGSEDSTQRISPNQTTLPAPTRSTRRPVDGAAETALVVQELVVPTIRERTYSAVLIREVPAEASRGRLSKSEAGSAKNTNRKLRGVSLPRSAFRNATSSDESSEASPRTPTDFQQTTFVRFPRRNPQAGVRDSMISSSSSLYPASTSSGSYPESSLLSPKEKDGVSSSFAPRIVTSSDFDVDDVSYRLRLLVNNNYFLPPAHHKPSPLSLSPQTPAQDQKAAKPAAPGFFDFLRMGKSKSKPTTPICHSPPVLDNPPPLLRTTSDSTTAGGYIPRPPAMSPTQVLAGSPFSVAPSNQSRVVVLRERVDDLMAAAKQAERDIKSRGDGRKAQSVVSPKTTYDDVIDPTDAVDLPHPSMGYPLQSLGPGEAVGADLLADRLPPSPGVWSMSSEEESWRKAILHEAVSLSLNESPEQSISSMIPSSPEPTSPSSFRAPTEDKTECPTSAPAPKATTLIGQRILGPTQLDSATHDTATLSPLNGVQSLPGAQVPNDNCHLAVELTPQPWGSTLSPPRSETPALTIPLTPPPPRKELSGPQHSASTNDLHRSASMDTDGSRSKDLLSTLRRAMSSPKLSVVHDGVVSPIDGQPESIEQRMSAMSPSLDIIVRGPQALSAHPSTNSLLRASPLFSDDDDLSYATPMDELDDEPQMRPSMTLSIPTIGRSSMSEYSNPSPTASAFNDVILQDAVFGSCRSPSPMLARRNRTGSVPAGSTPTPRPLAGTRQATMSPPPRESSTFGTALPPPPRFPAIRPIFRPSTASSHTSAHTTSSNKSAPLYSAAEPGSEVESNLQLSESPTSDRSPTSALAERRGFPSILSLQIPTEVISPALHSAPAPASPTAFFDRIQSHPNAMDDLETSDESDNDEEVPVPMPPPVMAPPSPSVPAPSRMSSSSRSSVKGALARLSQSGARPTIMRLGNHSSPHLTSGSGQEHFPAFDPDPRKPIGHIPERGTFFTARSRKKSGKGQATFPLPADSSRTARLFSTPGASTSISSAQVRSRSTSRRPATSSGAQERARPPQRESLQKFDGMLLEHIAAERDTIKRITNNISGSRS